MHLVTRRALARWFERWQFRTMPTLRAPAAMRRNHLLGQCIGAVLALPAGRRPRRLVVLRRR